MRESTAAVSFLHKCTNHFSDSTSMTDNLFCTRWHNIFEWAELEHWKNNCFH